MATSTLDRIIETGKLKKELTVTMIIHEQFIRFPSQSDILDQFDHEMEKSTMNERKIIDVVAEKFANIHMDAEDITERVLELFNALEIQSDRPHYFAQEVINVLYDCAEEEEDDLSISGRLPMYYRAKL